MISKDEKSKKVQQAELKLAQAKAQLAKVQQANATLLNARTALEIALSLPTEIAQNIRNEIIDVIRGVAERNRKLSLPIVGSKYIRFIGNRANLQSLEYMVHSTRRDL
jgi:adenylosuccinate lyase